MTDRTLDAFAARTRHHAEFDADELSRLKRAAGATVSVVLPARDEEATVGALVGRLRERLVDEAALVDELIVVDADSSDATAEVSRRAGAQVVRQSDVLPEAGPGSGKGEALWKGLAASSGDLVVFVDADLVDADDRFVVGLVGPLLTDTQVQLVKATYDRPLAVGSERLASGGGRVTELMARPLLAAFWPELSWLAQPLAGEYAGRRQLLESLPFVQGYGVELALLVDVAERYGPDAIVQVDLGQRVHRHQPLEDLGRMAAEILHVALDRLARQGRIVVPDRLATALPQPRRGADGDLHLVEHRVHPSERPPLGEWQRGGRTPT